MSEPQFFAPMQALSVGEIVELTDATPRDPVARDRRISGVAALDLAGPSELAFLDNDRYAGQLHGTRAGVCLIAPRFADAAPAHTALLVTREPYRAFVTVARRLFSATLRPSSLYAADAANVGAFIHPEARLETEVRIDPAAVIGARAEIGTGTVVGPGAAIGPGVRVGRHCAIGAGVTLTNALVGDRVIIHPGTRIGQDGFGYLMGPRGHQKVPQVGRVIIQDDVEIGANCTIDRGAGRDTMIGEGTKIDNLVQIGHNVLIGRHCVIVSQCGISGSVTLGDFVVLAGQVGISDHITIGDGAQIGAQSGLMNDVPAGERWFGYPAMRGRTYLRHLIGGSRGGRKKNAADASARAGDE